MLRRRVITFVRRTVLCRLTETHVSFRRLLFMLVELLMVVVVLREWSTHLVSRSLGALLCFRFACCGLLVHAVLLVYLFFISQAWGSWLMVADDFRESRENAGVDRDRGEAISSVEPSRGSRKKILWPAEVARLKLIK
jgi:hypothetical protein